MFKTRICDPEESLIKQLIYIISVNVLIGFNEHKRSDLESLSGSKVLIIFIRGK
ncbi:hypothetical protein VspSTUT11_39330 [Vibrio sp. STUT-A11]|nr:hypothetical protein VspSTUT11_39330 [Vibrio sp. STUT-A11]